MLSSDPADGVGVPAPGLADLQRALGPARPEKNSDIVESCYRAPGGTIDVIRRPGVGHHPHGLPDPTPIVDFIVKHAVSSR